MPILALKSVKKWKEKTKNDGDETEKDVAYIISKPPEPKHKLVLMRDKVTSVTINHGSYLSFLG